MSQKPTNGQNSPSSTQPTFDVGVGGRSTRPPVTPPPVSAAPDPVRETPAVETEPAYEPPPRRPKAERPQAFNAGAWLLEGLTGLGEELSHNDLGLPEEFWGHAYASRREGLLAAKALIDHILERTDAQEAVRTQRTQRQARRGNVSINFDKQP